MGLGLLLQNLCTSGHPLPPLSLIITVEKDAVELQATACIRKSSAGQILAYGYMQLDISDLMILHHDEAMCTHATTNTYPRKTTKRNGASP